MFSTISSNIILAVSVSSFTRGSDTKALNAFSKLCSLQASAISSCSGERRYFVGHRIYDVALGELVVIPKNELHRTTAQRGVGYEWYVVYFDKGCLDSLEDSIGPDRCREFIQSGCISLPSDCIGKIKSLLSIIANECVKGDKLSEAIMLNALHGIILYYW